MKSTYERRNGGSGTRHFKKSDGPKAKLRREEALKRLEAQLVRGTISKINPLPLTEENILRINKEIAILRKRI